MLTHFGARRRLRLDMAAFHNPSSGLTRPLARGSRRQRHGGGTASSAARVSRTTVWVVSGCPAAVSIVKCKQLCAGPSPLCDLNPKNPKPPAHAFPRFALHIARFRSAPRLAFKSLLKRQEENPKTRKVETEGDGIDIGAHVTLYWDPVAKRVTRQHQHQSIIIFNQSNRA